MRRTMAEQAQVVGIWEMRNHVPENRRMTRYVHPGKFIAGKRVTPEELARQCRLAQDYPFVYTRGPRPKKSPQIEEDNREALLCILSTQTQNDWKKWKS